MTAQTALQPTHRKRAAEITARQWTGTNIDEMRELCGGRFTPLDPADPGGHPKCTAEVRCSASGLWAPIEAGEWVVRDAAGALSVTSAAELAAEYEPIAPPGPHRVAVTVAAPGLAPAYQVEHPESCHAQRYELLCPFDRLRREVGTATWPSDPGAYEADIHAAHCGSPDYDEWDEWIEWTPVASEAGQ